MAATQKLFPTTRTERQIQRLGIAPWVLTSAALELFARRRRIRLRVVWGIVVPALVAYCFIVVNRLSLGHSSTASLNAYGFRTGLLTALPSGALLAGAEVMRWLDRRIARGLPTRVTRVERVPLWTVLGRVRTSYLAVALLVDAAPVVAAFVLSRHAVHSYRWGLLVAFACCAVSVILGVAREANRASIAIDQVSLAIDERTRSQETFIALAPLMFLANLAGYALLPAGGGLFVFVAPLSLVLWSIAGVCTPWPKPGPAPWVLQSARPVG